MEYYNLVKSLKIIFNNLCEITMKSITDQLIKTITEDLLKVERYSKALSLFIEESDTPITIGL